MDYYSHSGETDAYAPQQQYQQQSYQQQSYQQQSYQPVPMMKDEVVKLTEKVMFPLEQFPGYNFVGRLLGPKAATLRGLQSETKTKMVILGKGSTRDKKKEEELANSDDPEHAHFKEPLHVLIQVQAPKIEAHQKIAYALQSLYPFMVPESMEELEGHGQGYQGYQEGSYENHSGDGYAQRGGGGGYGRGGGGRGGRGGGRGRGRGGNQQQPRW